MSTYFTSDLHFWHKKIMEYEDRPFDTVEEMNEALIHNWNNTVKPIDDVYILGDVSFGNEEQTLKILNRLNGNMHLIYGNHDHVIKKSKMLQGKFAWCKDYYVLKTINPFTGNKIKLVLFHFPINVWEGKNYGSIHCYGHVHSNQKTHHPMTFIGKNSYNVGGDFGINNLTPISLEQVLINTNYKEERL
ncbi:metallophosphoesterase family protein [Clostridium tagluense]|uniref:Metallophosphatase n=1 Tax=Clostridium tagluense TaxID=360422 RepID=A0A401UTL9_9CLOT|nr:metallophosphoesterase family protein [Clostridium tagluense]GCD12887.1 metallophosphatase [Clostridium tagluense]